MAPTANDDIENNIDVDEEVRKFVSAYSGPSSRPNRSQRRHKMKNRKFTKKGFTRVVRVDNDGTAWNIPTEKGSRIHRIAQHNVKKLHRKKQTPYASKDGAGH